MSLARFSMFWTAAGAAGRAEAGTAERAKRTTAEAALKTEVTENFIVGITVRLEVIACGEVCGEWIVLRGREIRKGSGGLLEKGCGGDRYPREDAEKKVGGMVVYLYSFLLLCPLDSSLLFKLVSG